MKQFYQLEGMVNATSVEAPTDPLQSGIYQMDVNIDIAPVPFLSDFAALIIGALESYDDQGRFNQIFRNNGYNGTITIISRDVSWEWEIPYISVKRITIHYVVALTSPPVVLIALFSPAVILILKIVLAAVIIYGIGYILSYFLGPKSYSPAMPGSCANGYAWDESSKTCINVGSQNIFYMLVTILGIGIAVYIANQIGLFDSLKRGFTKKNGSKVLREAGIRVV